MNREILFRGKRLDGTWAEGYYVFNGETHGIVDSRVFPGSWSEVDPSTIGQFTGLTDKNGVKIFEGDIVVDEALNKGVVVWLTDAAQFLCDFGMDYHGIGTWTTVIGNQFDNPELIQQS